MWGDDGKECSYFSALPSLFAIIKHLKNERVENCLDEFKNIVGVSYNDALLLDEINNVGEAIKWQNPNKYLLYQDVLMGIYDSTVNDNYPTYFSQTARKLEINAKNNEFSYLFDCSASLCRVLEIKCVLGKKTRKAYEMGDKKELKSLLKEYGKLVERIEDFYQKFRLLWNIENKSIGFEVMDIRLGGLIMRIKNAERAIRRYVEGDIKKIDELEEKSTIYYSEEFIGKAVYAPEYKKIVTVNRL
jgi:hypothetical protein